MFLQIFTKQFMTAGAYGELLWAGISFLCRIIRVLCQILLIWEALRFQDNETVALPTSLNHIPEVRHGAPFPYTRRACSRNWLCQRQLDFQIWTAILEDIVPFFPRMARKDETWRAIRQKAQMAAIHCMTIDRHHLKDVVNCQSNQPIRYLHDSSAPNGVPIPDYIVGH